MVRSVDVDTDAELKRHFGNRVREFRLRRNLSQEALAELCELNRTYVGSVERGERNISLINIHRLASALAIEPHELLRP